MKPEAGVKEMKWRLPMDAIHQIIDGKILNQVIALPKPMQDISVEIIIKPANKQATPVQSKRKLTRSELLARLRGSHTELLSGAVQTNEDITLRALRAERRAKYECAD